MHDTFLRNLTLDIYGGSHDPQIGIRAGGFPKDEAVDTDALQAFLARRAPGSTKFGTHRTETDIPHFLWGIKDGKTDGGVIEAVIIVINGAAGRTYGCGFHIIVFDILDIGNVFKGEPRSGRSSARTAKPVSR